MKTLLASLPIALLLCWFPAGLFAQTASQTFVGPDGAFQFKYPSSLVHCTVQGNQGGSPSGWTPADSCAAYSPVCNGAEGRTLACFAYPKAEFKSDPVFGAAAFSVAVIANASTERQCMAAPPDAEAGPRRSGTIVEINHTAFAAFQISDAGMSHFLDGRVYRNFHRNTCYELGIRMASTNPAVFDPPARALSAQNKKKVMGALTQALDSFIFLR